MLRSGPRLRRKTSTWIDRDGTLSIVLGLAIVVIGLLWPYLGRLGLGRCPAISSSSASGTFYFPLVTCLLLSALFSLVLWLVNR